MPSRRIQFGSRASYSTPSCPRRSRLTLASCPSPQRRLRLPPPRRHHPRQKRFQSESTVSETTRSPPLSHPLLHLPSPHRRRHCCRRHDHHRVLRNSSWAFETQGCCIGWLSKMADRTINQNAHTALSATHLCPIAVAKWTQKSSMSSSSNLENLLPATLLTISTTPRTRPES